VYQYNEKLCKHLNMESLHLIHNTGTKEVCYMLNYLFVNHPVWQIIIIISFQSFNSQMIPSVLNEKSIPTYYLGLMTREG